MKLTDLTDVQLVEKALGEGSEAAYFTLYTRYHVGVCAHGSRLVQDSAEVEHICM